MPPGATPARTYFSLRGLAGGLLQLDTRVDLFHGMGFPYIWLSEARTLGESPEWGLDCFHGSVCMNPEPRPRPLPPHRPAAPAALPPALGPLRGPVVCSVEWKIPPRPCESSQSHPLRLRALERNGSVFPLHGEQAGSRIRAEGAPTLPPLLTKWSLSEEGPDLSL